MNHSNFSTPKSPEFERLLQSFQSLAQFGDPIREEFELVQSARAHRLLISSYRKMYRSWLLQQLEMQRLQKGGQANG